MYYLFCCFIKLHYDFVNNWCYGYHITVLNKPVGKWLTTSTILLHIIRSDGCKSDMIDYWFVWPLCRMNCTLWSQSTCPYVFFFCQSLWFHYMLHWWYIWVTFIVNHSTLYLDDHKICTHLVSIFLENHWYCTVLI